MAIMKPNFESQVAQLSAGLRSRVFVGEAVRHIIAGGHRRDCWRVDRVGPDPRPRYAALLD